MLKSAIKAKVKKVRKMEMKRRALMAQYRELEDQESLIKRILANETCEIKRGAVLKSYERNIWVKVKKIISVSTRIGCYLGYEDAPYELECLRCNAKGVTKPGVWVFIRGIDLSKWGMINE